MLPPWHLFRIALWQRCIFYFASGASEGHDKCRERIRSRKCLMNNFFRSCWSRKSWVLFAKKRCLLPSTGISGSWISRLLPAKHRHSCLSFVILWTQKLSKGKKRQMYVYVVELNILATVHFYLNPLTNRRFKKRGSAGLYRGSISYFCGQDPRCLWVWHNILFLFLWKKKNTLRVNWVIDDLTDDGHGRYREWREDILVWSLTFLKANIDFLSASGFNTGHFESAPSYVMAGGKFIHSRLPFAFFSFFFLIILHNEP